MFTKIQKGGIVLLMTTIKAKKLVDGKNAVDSIVIVENVRGQWHTVSPFDPPKPIRRQPGRFHDSKLGKCIKILVENRHYLIPSGSLS